MNVKIRKSKKNSSVSISGELTIYSVQECRSKIIKGFSTEKDLSFDLSGIEEIDVSGLQLLSVIRKQLEINGSKMNLTVASDTVKDAIHLSGFCDAQNNNQREN